MALVDNGKGRQIEDPLGGNQEDGARGKYLVGRANTEESAANIAMWSGKETEDEVTEEEDKTTGGEGRGCNDVNRYDNCIGGKRRGKRYQGDSG